MRLVILLTLHALIATSAFSASPLIAFDRNSSTSAVARGTRVTISTEPRKMVELDFIPTLAAVNRDTFLFADTITDRAALITRHGIVSKQFATGTTPVRVVPFRDGFLMLTRDDASLTFIGNDGGTRSIAVAEGSALLETANDRATVYSPVTGELMNVDASLRITSRMKSATGASDMEPAGDYLYLVHPGEGRIDVHDARTLDFIERVSAGAVPVDVETIGNRTAIGAGTLLIADPSSKRVWREEGTQSELEAFSRGFLRGMLGLGLFTPRSNEMPAGADRLLLSGNEVYALDSSSGTLYHVGRKSVAKVASGVAWSSLAADGEGRILLALEVGVETIGPPRIAASARRSARQ